MTAIPSELTDEQTLAALAVEATASGAAALLSRWTERTVTADEVVRHVTASPRLQRIAAFSAQAQGHSSGWVTEERIRRAAGRGRWRDRRARK